MTEPTYELHDAKVSSVSSAREGITEIEFAHLPVYFEDASGLVEHWSHTATLVISGVTEVPNSWTQPERIVSDAIVTDPHGARLDEAKLEAGVNIRDVRLVFTDGSDCAVKGTHVKMVIKDKTRLVERFRQ